MSTPASENPGNVLASAVDAEIAKFRQLQEQLHALRGDLQVVMGQQTENEMVQTELNLLDTSSKNSNNSVFKRVGPVLIRQSLEDAKETVSKRLEFIQGEHDKMNNKMMTQEKELQELGLKIQQMQTNMQRMTAQAVQAIQQQHQQTAK